MANINFKGKEIVRNHHLTVPYHELVPDAKRGLSKKPSLNDNLIIHGDNLLALKALLPIYAGKVKCIYIDPPYNTGNEKWEYNDNVSSPMMKEWLGKVVDKDDLTRHDKWLCMMMPRLKLMRELLRDDGVIFVSIDDNEVGHLLNLMDEVFQPENYVQTMIWQKNSGGGNDTAHVAVSHEYILCYAKSINDSSFRIFNVPPTEGMLKAYDLVDEFVSTRGKHTLRSLNDFSVGDRPGLHYDIECPDKTILEGDEHRWRCDEKKYFERLADKRIVFHKNDDDEWEVFYKLYINEQKGHLEVDEDGTILSYGKKPNSLIYKLAFTGDGKKDLQKLFGFSPFSYPKPVKIVKYLLSIGSRKDDIILDSFAGSGTTGQAVLELNADEKVSERKFILIQMPELIKQKVYLDKTTGKEVDKPKRGKTRSEVIVKPYILDKNITLKEIIDVALQRLLRVSKAIGGGTKSSFSYYELGKPIDTERILKGKDLPTFAEMARYIFYTATGEEFNEKKVSEKTGLIGESKEYQVYLLYKPDMEYLKSTALTLERAEALGKFGGKKRLVFAPMKYLDQEHLERLHIDFAQLPFEIYQKQ